MAGSASERERTREMIQEYCRTRDRSLRNLLVQEYLYIAEISARRFSGRGVEYDDLLQVASLALIKALDRFDCSKGVDFTTFATPSVVGEVKNYFRDKLRLVRLPRRSTEILQKADAVRERLSFELGRNPTTAEIAAAMKLPLEIVVQAMESRMAGYGVSLDEPVGDGEAQIADTLGAPDPSFESVEINDYLKRELDKLDDTERRVIIARFVGERSQRDVASELNVSQMYISRLERRVLSRLRQAYEA
ncbi:MAG: sigma-70 family RNA polymerase sigma factor [Candidatus Fimadaptatus sp.]|jgi:RNA polymerase sigma-B factor